MSEQNVMDSVPHETAGDFDGGDFAGDDFSGDSFESGERVPGQPAPPGMGQSKSSRRRRRKRKNKMAAEGSTPGSAAEGGFPAGATIVMEGESIALAASGGDAAPAARAPRQPRDGGFQNNGNGNQGNYQQGGGQGQGVGKRWKKKFRDRDRRKSDNPGNESRGDNNNGGGGYQQGGYGHSRGGGLPDNFGNLVGGFKRKQKGGDRKERNGFVGPMDHSYREAEDGAAAPPSTINLRGSAQRRGGHRHHGDNQPIDYNMPRPIPIPENAECHIYFFIEELFFVAKIQETAKKLGVKVAFLKGGDKDVLAELTDAETNKPALIVFDLNNANAKPMTVIPKLKAKLKKSVSIVGFLSHLQGDLKAKAVEAGCDVVMPRSAFSQNLPNLLRRYGAEEEEEINYNY